MASVYYLCDDGINIVEDIVSIYSYKTELEKKKYFAAIKIQKIYRAYTIRKLVKKWNNSATIIQKTVRGWLTRYHLPDFLNEYNDRMCMNYYNTSATKIQSLWKGYKVRKQVDVKEILAEKQRVQEANDNAANIIREQNKIRSNPNHPQQQQNHLNSVLNVMFDRHHLLRTHQKEGTISVHGSNELSELERLMSNIPWTKYMKKLRKIYNTYSTKLAEPEYMFTDKKLRKIEDLMRLRNRDIRQDLSGLAQRNIHEKGFNVNSKIEQTPYERMVTNSDPYKLVNKHITRTEDRSKDIPQKHLTAEIVPEYYLNFWFEKCVNHNLPDVF